MVLAPAVDLQRTLRTHIHLNLKRGLSSVHQAAASNSVDTIQLQIAGAIIVAAAGAGAVDR